MRIEKNREFHRQSYDIWKFAFSVFLAVVLWRESPAVRCGIVRAQEEAQEAGAEDGQTTDDAPEQEDVVVVIDPGHGGENLGGEYEDYTEKEMTMIVANAMKEELEKYDGVRVYMTRTGDQELSLEERCEYAKSVNADFLFCLHFNMSEHHTLFGAECWVSAFGEHYSKGYSFASVEIDMLQELGLYSRGIKTRLNDRGTDYYGIIRQSVERDIPCVLIEHCHLDQENDQPFYDHHEKLLAFGRLDATAVAKYFQLSSTQLDVDYSGYQNVSVNVPANVVSPDRTEPDVCMIEVTDQDMQSGEVRVRVSAADYDSGMLYYTYSYDNGQTFSPLQRWPGRSADTFEFTMQVPPRILPMIVVNGYNGYDLYTTSNMISLPSMDYKTAEEIAEQLAAQEALESASDAMASEKEQTKTVRTRTIPEQETEKPMSFSYFLAVCAVCALLVLAMTVSMVLILGGRKRKRRRKRRGHRKTGK